MASIPLEYTLCLIQRDIFSFARRSHRVEDGDPRLEIVPSASGVDWRLLNIDEGILETTDGAPRVDRIDFYFRTEALKHNIPMFPSPMSTSDPTLVFPPVSSSGTERREGKRVRIAMPICRFSPVTDVRLIAAQPTPFEAIAGTGTLHLDMETGPKSIYGVEIFEVHLGIQAEYAVSGIAPPTASYAEFSMSPQMYATVLDGLKSAVA